MAEDIHKCLHSCLVPTGVDFEEQALDRCTSCGRLGYEDWLRDDNGEEHLEFVLVERE